MQRFVYDDIKLETYLRFVRARRASSTRALCLYASDAEIFDFRPGRFRTEEKLPQTSEWERVDKALSAVTAEPGIDLIAPSHVLKLIDREGGGNLLQLESADCPVPVKKQRKYNLARWAVTGRDNIAVNAACERIYRGMLEHKDADWKELCYLWASDFRTHLTEKRWADYRVRLQAAEEKYALPAASSVPVPQVTPATDRHLNIETGTISARLDRRRGLALERIHFAGNVHAVVGGLPHGTFRGHRAAGRLVHRRLRVRGARRTQDHRSGMVRGAGSEELENGDIVAHASIETPKGRSKSRCGFRAANGASISISPSTGKTGARACCGWAISRFCPTPFSLDGLRLATTNGGGRESFSLAGKTIDHGAPVSFLVSSSHGLGMTEGWAEIGDDKTRLRIEVDRCTAPLLGMLTHRPARRSDGSAGLFCQLQLSAMELDDTRKPSNYRDGPRRFRFSIEPS